MLRVRNALLASLWVVIISMVLAPIADAQGLRIGFVKDDRIKKEYKAWQRAQEEWDLEARAWEDEAVASQQDLQELEDEYNRQKLILSEEKKKEREAAINAKREALDAFTSQVYGPNGSAERKQMQLIQPLLENITKAIEDVAIEDNYDVIFTLQSGLGYIKETYDMTDRVLERLEEME